MVRRDPVMYVVVVWNHYYILALPESQMGYNLVLLWADYYSLGPKYLNITSFDYDMVLWN